MMHKKDYERAAQVCQAVAQVRPLDADTAVSAFVTFFEEDGNPLFDKERFRAACVPGANVRARPKRAKGDS